jgi:hypothetical protein
MPLVLAAAFRSAAGGVVVRMVSRTGYRRRRFAFMVGGVAADGGADGRPTCSGQAALCVRNAWRLFKKRRQRQRQRSGNTERNEKRQLIATRASVTRAKPQRQATASL